MNTYEYIKVDITHATEDQLLSSNWIQGTSKLTSARAELEAVVLTNEDESTILSTQNWIFVGPGRTGTNSFSNSLEQNYLNPTTGSLDTLTLNR